MRRFDSAPFLALLAALALVACGILDPDDDERDRLNDAIGRWNAQQIADYEYRYSRSCECLPDYTRPHVVNVVDGRIVEVHDAETGGAPPEHYEALTVAGLFGVVDDAIERHVHTLGVDYHPRLGYPTRISVDQDAQTVDDEFIIRAEALATVAAVR